MSRQFFEDIEVPHVLLTDIVANQNHAITKQHLDDELVIVDGNLNSHVNNSTIHFIINDVGSAINETFSAQYSRAHFNDTDLHVVVKPILNSSEIRCFYADTVRNKLLSTDTIQFLFGETVITSNDWLKSGVEATGNRAHHITTHDCTIVGISLACENDNGSTSGLRVYRNNINSILINFPGDGNNSNNSIDGIDIDVPAGTRIRVRGQSGFNRVQDTTVILYLKFRG